MADNVTLPGTGSSVAADDIGGALYQRVKLTLGADGAAEDLAPGQATMANSVPVAIASNQSDVPVTLDGEAVVLGAGSAAIGSATDGGPSWTSVYTFTTSADATGGADITAAPTGGQKIVITDLVVSTDTAMSISFLEETSGTEVLRLYLPASGTVQVTPRSKMKLATADKKLRIDASTAGNVAVTAFYHSEA